MSTTMNDGNLSGLTNPAFFAYLSSNQTVTNGGRTKVNFNAERFDTNSCYDSTTNFRFTPNVAGYYLLNSNVTPCAVSGSYYLTNSVCYFYKNGLEFRNGSEQSSGSERFYARTAFASGIMYLNGSTDYAEVYVYTYSNAASPKLLSGYTIFSGILITS